MKRIITSVLPTNFERIVGVTYNGKLDYLVEDDSEVPIGADYVSKMDSTGVVTELQKSPTFVFEHHFAGWDNFSKPVEEPSVNIITTDQINTTTIK